LHLSVCKGREGKYGAIIAILAGTLLLVDGCAMTVVLGNFNEWIQRYASRPTVITPDRWLGLLRVFIYEHLKH
jgi:hypothetical protein